MLPDTPPRLAIESGQETGSRSDEVQRELHEMSILVDQAQSRGDNLAQQLQSAILESDTLRGVDSAELELAKEEDRRLKSELHATKLEITAMREMAEAREREFGVAIERAAVEVP